MPEMNTGFTREFRAADVARKVPLGQGIETFIKTALPELAYLSVLRFLVENAKASSSAGEIAKVICEPKATVQKALDHFVGLEILRSSMSLFSRKYALLSEGPKVEAARKIVKLWDHPQTHGSVMAAILRNGPEKA